jgi:AsmA protein
VDFDSTHYVAKHTGVLRSGTVHLGKALLSLSGNYNVEGKVPSVVLKLSGTKVPLEELTAFLPSLDVQLPNGSSIKGGTLTIQMASSGPISALVTQGSFDVEGTTLEHFDLGGKMRTLEALAGIQGGLNTEFQTISAKMEQTNEGTTLQALSVVAPAVGNLAGAGTIAPDKSLDLKMKVNLRGAELVAGGIPFTVAGTTSNPVVKPQIGAALKTVTKGAATKIGTDLLNNFLNPKKAPAK